MTRNVDDARARGKAQGYGDGGDAAVRHGEAPSGFPPLSTREALRLALDELGRLQADVGAFALRSPGTALGEALERGARRRLGFVEAALRRARGRVTSLERRCGVLLGAITEVRDGPEEEWADLMLSARELDGLADALEREREAGPFFAVTEAGRAALAAAVGTVD